MNQQKLSKAFPVYNAEKRYKFNDEVLLYAMNEWEFGDYKRLEEVMLGLVEHVDRVVGKEKAKKGAFKQIIYGVRDGGWCSRGGGCPLWKLKDMYEKLELTFQFKELLKREIEGQEEVERKIEERPERKKKERIELQEMIEEGKRREEEKVKLENRRLEEALVNLERQMKKDVVKIKKKEEGIERVVLRNRKLGKEVERLERRSREKEIEREERKEKEIEKKREEGKIWEVAEVGGLVVVFFLVVIFVGRGLMLEMRGD